MYGCDVQLAFKSSTSGVWYGCRFSICRQSSGAFSEVVLNITMHSGVSCSFPSQTYMDCAGIMLAHAASPSCTRLEDMLRAEFWFSNVVSTMVASKQ